MSDDQDKLDRFNRAFERLVRPRPGDEAARSVERKSNRTIIHDMPRGFCLAVGDPFRPCGLMIVSIVLNDGSRGEARILELGTN